jgi:hypothetical protein
MARPMTMKRGDTGGAPAQVELERHLVPRDFVWGVSTSSYQIEGGAISTTTTPATSPATTITATPRTSP